MRIRSIKPEFWRSDDVAALSIEDRLLFIGLWSYVDDNGVGRDQLADICADLFSRDWLADPRETVARVSRGLQHLETASLIARYTVDGRPFLHVSTWEQHQRVDRPNRPRYPGPDQGIPSDSRALATPSRHPRDDLATGTGEQRNRGTEEQRNRKDGQLTLTAEVNEQPSTDDLFDHWWAAYPRKVHKPAARKAFTAALPKVHPDRGTAGEILTAAIREHSRHWHDLEGRPVDKIPHPATWLNAEAWNDELPPDDAYRTRPAAAATETPTERIMRMRTAALAQLNGGESRGDDRRMPRPALGARVS